jgi:hypothetical protein
MSAGRKSERKRKSRAAADAIVGSKRAQRRRRRIRRYISVRTYSYPSYRVLMGVISIVRRIREGEGQ